METIIMIFMSLVAFSSHYEFWYSHWKQYQTTLESHLMLNGFDEETAKEICQLIKNPLFFGWGQQPLSRRAVTGMLYIIEILLYCTCIFQIYGEYSMRMLGIFIGVTTIPVLVLLVIELLGWVEEKLNAKREEGI